MSGEKRAYLEGGRTWKSANIDEPRMEAFLGTKI